jgi:hypothetical protein
VEVTVSRPGNRLYRTKTVNGEFEFSGLSGDVVYEVVAADSSTYPPLIGITSNICVDRQDAFVQVKLGFSNLQPDFYFPGLLPMKGKLTRDRGKLPRPLTVKLYLGDELIASTEANRKGVFRFAQVPVFKYVSVVINDASEFSFRQTFWFDGDSSGKIREFAVVRCDGAAGSPN